MWKNIICQSILQIVVLGAILFKGPQIFGIESSIGVRVTDWNNENGRHYCIFFNTFVLMQVFNEINARKLKEHEINVFSNFFNNPLFIFILILTVIIQISCVEFGGQSLRTVPLTQHEHLICLGLGSLPLLFAPIFKLIVPSSLFNALSKPGKHDD
jgi:magnesium-transporting ATPase (P-type)